MANAVREERLKRNLEYLGSHLMAKADPAAMPGPPRTTRGKAAVVCWDLSHNPAGRAYVLAKLLATHWNTELVGPIWPRFGKTLWEPLLDSGIAWHPLHVSNLEELIVAASALALAKRYDLVVVSKPRLPGLLLGLFLAEQSRCPLVLDFDEDERAFLQHHVEDPGDASAKLLAEPFGTSGTLLAAQYWTVADATTVASPALRRIFGGHLVRHSRDETAAVADRAAARRRLGYGADDIVMAFIGTVRAHKGLDRVLTAMEAIGDPRLRLLVVGSIDEPALRTRLMGMPKSVRVFPPCPLKELTNYLAAADLVPLLQNPAAAIAQSQFPAKLTDALQHGVPIVAIATPPLSEGGLNDAVDWIEPYDLKRYLDARLLDGNKPDARRARIRAIFEDEFSDGINRVRLDAAVRSAMRVANPFGRTRTEALRGIMDTVRRARADLQRGWLSKPSVRRDRARYDVAFFWKQNDSGLFGRRADLVTEYLPRTGLVRRIVHFDHSLHGSTFARMGRDYVAHRPTSFAMQFRNQALRALRLLDRPDMLRRLLLTEAPNAPPGFGGEPYYAEALVPERVAAVLREENCDPDRTIAWVCPIVWNFPAIAEHVAFHRIVVDLIDDQRSWARNQDELQRVQTTYERTLRHADLVLTNAEGNRAGFEALRDDIHVIPNGAELDFPSDSSPLPGFMRDSTRPVVGYCGNLSERIDWPLIEALATRHPDWRFVLIGPHGEGGVRDTVLQLPNVTLPGPLPYDEARRCMVAFDCAIVPHIPNAITDAMNPLKVYNYLSVGIPVVTTPVANLEALHGLIRIGDGPDAFANAIAEALATPRNFELSDDIRERIGWESRMAKITSLLESLD
ncbi:glycosyltransferase [Rhodopila sp.]|uniref:glycosyltransferase n=1 Tax=Rhodopila sp. TaxID=2480087 RepID=UPI002C10E766|nr:glycosyltransferase [Rhodopila sp.]HVZ10022.1 glycosyltransferase [Rhodopila sp.]